MKRSDRNFDNRSTKRNEKPKVIIIHFNDSYHLDYESYEDTDNETYQWIVGTGGELHILRTRYHHQFAAALEEDKRVRCYARGTWNMVEIEDKEAT